MLGRILGQLNPLQNRVTRLIKMVGVSIIEAEGAAVASAATTEIWATDGSTRHITGTATITSLGTATQAGQWQKIIFDDALVLTHGANLNLPGSANITTAADDFAWVYADTTTQHDVLYFPKTGKAVVATTAVGVQILHLQDQKASGTQGGASSATTWNERTLNTTVVNTITGASLASNEITLPAGTYRVWATAPGGPPAGRQRLRLYNTADASEAVVGMNATDEGVVLSMPVSLFGSFIIAAQKTFKLQHYTQTATATFGLGHQVGTGGVEIYANIWIWKE